MICDASRSGLAGLYIVGMVICVCLLVLGWFIGFVASVTCVYELCFFGIWVRIL